MMPIFTDEEQDRIDAKRVYELGIEDLDIAIERQPMELRDQFGRVLKRRRPTDLDRVMRAQRGR